jgi:ribonucleoside-diphosphate reductase alpha chain
VTIAPADPASATPAATPPTAPAGAPTGVPPADDGPGAALLRTLTELTGDLPGADPGRVAAAALLGRSAQDDDA